MLPNRASANSLSAPIRSSGGFRDSLDDKSKASVVQIKGMFSVTSENLDHVKGSPLRKSTSVGDWLLDSKQASTITAVTKSQKGRYHTSGLILVFMAEPISLPLQERISLKSNTRRVLSLTILFLFFSLLYFRICSLKEHGVTWLLAFLCESWFTFLWAINVSSNWNPVEYKTYPDRLLKRFQDLPPLDIFVTTADPVLEPPILTVNTVLSLLALDYPPNKLACYVSDDSASPITFYSLSESIKLAKLWIPYCKKYNVQVRAPFLYFSVHEPDSTSHPSSPEFVEEWKHMKTEYETLTKKVEEAVQNFTPLDLTGELATFSNATSENHPSIVKIIWENKEDFEDRVPHLIYVSREKQPTHPHHFKAGAMNVLTRVSGVMTNAPFMLNVDCDMFANNPNIVLHAMCLLLGHEKERDSAFVQCPQLFYGGLKDDPFGNQMVVWQGYLLHGVAGIQGPNYTGTGCFHRRKSIYGLSPDDVELGKNVNLDVAAKLDEETLRARFGYSMELTKSATQLIYEETAKSDFPDDLLGTLEASTEVANCSYEFNTQWGTKVGWVYGSATEDILTGQRIHAMGWSTVYCTPDPVPFLGCAPSAGPVIMVQQKRWATGLLEILFSKRNPIVACILGDLWFRQCFAYLWMNLWGLASIPELCYSILPAYSLLTDTPFMPKVSETATLVAAPLFILYNVYVMSEFLGCGLSINAWWNNRRMSMITATTGRLFGVLAIVIKLAGLSETVFEVTPKEQNATDDHNVDPDPGRFTFNDSPMFVPGTALVMVNIVALAMGLVSFKSLVWINHSGSGLLEIMCSTWVLVSFLPYVKGLYRKAIKHHKELQRRASSQDYGVGVTSQLECQRESDRIATKADLEQSLKDAVEHFKALATKKIARELKQQLEAITAAGRLLPDQPPATAPPDSAVTSLALDPEAAIHVGVSVFPIDVDETTEVVEEDRLPVEASKDLK
ncbi:hypothetical protein IFM89_007643 [Coptis chinensis]|uniref:Cellulose synthase-like protein H1 n=1 Tax=Coptis chinensis TaxID=261450 RepID=A0A835LTP7_9MAGN|nr:hypothetical protein IFM89_007643 [Coptis chinensis]